MKYLVIFIFLLFSFQGQSQSVEVIKYEDLERMLTENSDDVQVINFWATWCRPCIKELPYFEAVNDAYEAEGVKVILVSFDFVEDLETKVIPFVNKREISSEVKLLDETDYNAFIDKVDPSWSGAIPATLIINHKTGKRSFYEKEFEQEELFSIVEEHLN